MTDEDYRVPVSREIKATINELAHYIKGKMPPGWGFGLMMFTFGDHGDLVWLSSGTREDMVKVMQEFIRKQGA